MIWAWLAVQLALATACALAAGAGSARRSVTAVLLAMAIALPLFASLAPLNVVVLCFVSLIVLVKTTQIASSRGDWPIGRRLWHLFGLVDTRGARSVPPAMDLRALGVVLLNCMLLAGAALALTRLSGISGFAHRAAWVVCTATAVYAWFEVVSGVLRVGYLAFGVDVPTLQRNPIISRSLAEFWGQRWNRVMSGWLREFMFDPLARRRHPQLGLAAAFSASAAIHAWLFLALGTSAALMVAAYFLLQGAALFVEARLDLRRVSPIIGRLWTIIVLLAPLPLLVDSFFQSVELEFAGKPSASVLFAFLHA